MKNIIKKILNVFGYRLSKLPLQSLLHENAFIGIGLQKVSEPYVFDIGANVGQTLIKIKKVAPQAIVHLFEPSPSCYTRLGEVAKSYKNVTCVNSGIGSRRGELLFNEYSWSALNSFLEREYTKSEIIEQYNVDVITVDSYCKSNDITHLHLLKTDTEGFELEVLKGAENMLSSGSIEFVLVEIFFNLNFKEQGSFGDIYNLLLKHNYGFVRFYNIDRLEDGRASRTDALFKRIK